MNKKNPPSDSALRIGIDARLYGPKNGGIGRYIQKLLENLGRLDSRNTYVVFLNEGDFDDFVLPGENFIKVAVDCRAYSFKEQIVFPFHLNKYHLDLVHFPHFNVPLLYRKKFIVTIHDLIISHYPDSRATTLNPIFYRLKLFFYRRIVKSTAKRANEIITVSQFSKKDIVDLLAVTQDKVKVIYEGYDLPLPPEENSREILEKYRLTSDYLLYVGSAYPHKNLGNLLIAFHYLIQEKKSLQLVLAGKDSFFYDRLKEQIEKNGLAGRVVLTGFVSDRELAGLYRQAALYVFPSLIEGFGLPPLEAQSYDLPVASSNATCLPEILGDSAVFFDPSDPYEMTQKIKLALNDNSLRQDLIKRGRENLKKYSWQDLTKKTLDIYLGK